MDDFATIPQQNIAHAMTSVMAQNVGAGNAARVKQTYRVGMYCELIYGVAVGAVAFFMAGPLIRLFSSDPEVIMEGRRYMRLIAVMYPAPAFTNGLQGYFRGTGDLKVTLYSSLINMGVRVASEIPMVFVWKWGFISIPWSYLLGWIAMSIFELPFLIRRLRQTGERGCV